MTAPEREVGWSDWIAELTSEFAKLAEGDWLTFTVPGADTGAFVQVRLLQDVIALECIADTEFEGQSDLSSEQQEALARLGWQPDGQEPDFNRTFPADQSAAAAELVGASFRDVLGAGLPDQVDIRRPS